MSLDERLRAGLRQGVDGHAVSTSQALAEVERMQTKQRTRSTMIGLAAAAALLAAGVAVGPGVVESLNGQSDVAPVQQPTDDAVVIESAQDMEGVWTTSGVRDVYFAFTPDGTFTISRGSPTEPALDSGRYRVDGSVLTMESLDGGCIGTVGRYVVTFPDQRTLSTALIQDTCGVRAADFDKGAPVQKVPPSDLSSTAPVPESPAAGGRRG